MRYTSPFTDTTYSIVPDTFWHQSWDENGNPYKASYTEYSLYHNDKLVLKTFSIDENVLKASVGEYEGAYAAWSTSRFD